MEYPIHNVNKHTRAGRYGKLIFCPECFLSTRVFHFSWSGMWCKNKKCHRSYEQSPNISIPKNEWFINVKLK